jgi:8-oxo-(d)GTP phosphatase
MASPPVKTLVIIRHAHRNKPHGNEGDDGLSRKGQRQARRARDYYKERYGKAKPELLSSAKRRCTETLDPIAEITGTEVVISPLLMEQGGIDKAENFAAAQKRVRQFCEEWRSSKKKLTVVSSHGDLIPEILKYLTGANADLKKGGWAEIICESETPCLNWLLQEL